jgi:transmembrane sensor
LQAKMRKKKATRVLVYAIATIAIGIIVFVVLDTVKNNAPSVARSLPAQHDLAPGGNKAVLTLADGKKITLTGAQNGNVAKQGKVNITKTADGQLVYSRENHTSLQMDDAAVNTIETPRGGQYQLMLSDGSRVWLNAVSSLKYPADFSGNARVVELSGEGYFEVAKNALKPFHIKVNGADVQVLGTHFNINAYNDENKIKTTLLEGSVKITVQNNVAVLKPGQQGLWLGNSEIRILDAVNLTDATSWKSGLFSFHREDMQAIMRQVGRWYDVSVQYDGEAKKHFTATIERNVPVSKLLKLLEGTGDVHFTILDKTIIVKP